MKQEQNYKYTVKHSSSRSC